MSKDEILLYNLAKRKKKNVENRNFTSFQNQTFIVPLTVLGGIEELVKLDRCHTFNSYFG